MSPEITSLIEIFVLLVVFCAGYGLGRADKNSIKGEPETLERLWRKGKK